VGTSKIHKQRVLRLKNIMAFDPCEFTFMACVVLLPYGQKNSSSCPVSEKLQFFNTDEFIERTGREEKNDVQAAECRARER